jgi:hypothetical protein
MSAVVLEELLKPSLVRRDSPALPTPALREIGYGYCPGRSLGLSIIFHLLALLLIVISSSRLVHIRAAAAQIMPPRIEPVHLDEAIYLPALGGGSEGAGQRGGGSGVAQEASSGLRARSRRGFAYPGPQPMISDPPRATLGMQTILQPTLKNPPLLRRYMPLPNIAQAPPPTPAEPQKPILKVQSGRLAIRPADKLVQAPKVTLATATVNGVPALGASEAIMPQSAPSKPEVPPAEISDLPVDRRGQQGVLVLNAVPPPPDVPTKLPLAEARSLFAVTPAEATIIADPAAGAKSGGLPSMAAGSGTPADIASGDALAETAAGGGSSKSSGGSGSGNGGRYGSGKGSGLNPAGEAAGAGRGTSAGAGTGSAAGTTLGSGKGAGSAPGGGGFPGITIRGGSGHGNSANGSMLASLSPHRQTAYGMTITSTASSGGGLPDFGVFQNEKVYTVYLDMRADDEDPAPSWTLQYAVVQPPADSAANGAISKRVQGTPTPPYALFKEIPVLTAQLASTGAHQLIVASAIMDVTGRLEQVSVKRTPDNQLIAPVIEALSNWTFQPAQIDGKPVALKILLGVRLAPPPR